MIRSLGRIVTISIALLSICGAQQRGQRKHDSPQATAQPDSLYSTLLLQNQDITIRRLNIPVGAEAPIAATTHDYLLISIGNNAISAKGERNSFDLDLGPGDMQVIDGGWQHALVNREAGEAVLFMIEPARDINPQSAICGLGQKGCREHDFAETPEGTYNELLQFETETTKLYRLSMDAGVKAHLHLGGQKYLIVALTSFQGHQDTEKFNLKAGDMRWMPTGFKELGNDGANEARVLILELK